MSAHLAKTILGVLGDLTSFALFISPMPTFITIFKSKSTLEFHPYIYLAGVLNCFFWVFYSMPFVHPDSTPITIVNSIGLFLYFCYLFIFFWYTDTKVPEKKYDRHKIVIGVLIEIAFAAFIAFCGLHFFHTTKTRTKFVGYLCVIFSVILYGAPLSIMIKVVKTKSVEFLPFWVSVGGFLNGIVWGAYALLPLDAFVLTPNGIGSFLSAIQLFLHLVYRDTTPKKKKQSEVQLEPISETA